MDPTASALGPRHAAELLRAATATLHAELGAMPPDVLSWHPAPGEWCAKEVVGHLVEAEQRGFAGRVRQVLASAEEPRFEPWDQVAVARARHDCARQLGTLLDEFGAVRESSVTLVRALREADLGRGGHHPQVGYLRVGDLLHEWVHHDRNHLAQILANVQAYVWPHMGNAQRFSRP